MALLLRLSIPMKPKYLKWIRAVLGVVVGTALATLALAADTVTERAPLLLTQGEQRLLRVSGLIRYTLGSPIVRALPLGHAFPHGQDSVLVRAVSVGQSDLWVWKRDGSSEHRSIEVQAPPRGTPENSPLWRSLSKLTEVEVLIAGDLAVLRGSLNSPAEAARIWTLLQSYPKQIRDETEPSLALLDSVEVRLQTWIRNLPAGFARLELERIPLGIRVSGTLPHPSDRASVERQIHVIYPLAEIELGSLPDGAPTIFFRVFLLEIHRNRFGSFGLSWPTNVPAAVTVTPSRITSAFALDAAIQALEGQGNGKVLSNPELVVRAPGEAELFAGGEIPIETKTHYSSQVEWKRYGLTLQLKVAQATNDRVRLDIATEVSHLDSNLTIDRIPGLQSNRMKTQVDAQFGKPLFLSGLLQDGMRTEARGLPILRRIPVLGALFGSEDYLSERSELVAVLLPHASPPTAPLQRVTRLTPLGQAPLPRNQLSPEEETRLRESADYPWNALEDSDADSPKSTVRRSQP